MRDSIKNIVQNLHYDKAATLLVQVWVHNSATIIWDDQISAPAMINMASKQVYVNPTAVGEMVEDVMTRVPKHQLEPFIIRRSDTLEENLVHITVLFLLLHEISHNLYSPTVEMMMAAFAASSVPEKLNAFSSNITEDSFIQAEHQKEYPGAEYRIAWKFGQMFYQGDLNSYEKTLNDPQALARDPVYQLLYYFILRAYNELEPRVIRLFDSPVLPWQSDTIELFDQAQHTSDTETRLKTTLKFAELVMRDLKNSPQVQQALKKGGGDPQSGNNPQQGAGPGQQQNSNQAPNGANGANGAGGDSKQQGSNKQQSAANGQSTNAASEANGSGSTSAGSQAQTLKEAVEKAAEKLNAKLGEKEYNKNRTKANQQTLQKRAQSHSAAIGAQAMGIRRKELQDQYSRMPEWAMTLYEDCALQWAKIFNQTDYTLHGLDEGDIDPLLITEWYAEKNHRIFCQDVHVRQGKNIQAIFILDHSGSMGRSASSRFGACAHTLAAMCHAFDEAKIKSTIFDFGSDVCLLKTVDEVPELVGNESNILNALQTSSTGGGTDPSRAWEAIRDDPAFANEDEKIVFFLTDGEMGSSLIEETVQKTIQELTDRGHWFFVSIGLDFNERETANLARFTAPGVVKAYTTDELSSKLGEDIFELVTEFI